MSNDWKDWENDEKNEPFAFRFNFFYNFRVDGSAFKETIIGVFLCDNIQFGGIFKLLCQYIQRVYLWRVKKRTWIATSQSGHLDSSGWLG